MTFTQNTDCSDELLFERESLERTIRLVEKNRIIEHRIADYIGTWDISEPSRGYFEVFGAL